MLKQYHDRSIVNESLLLLRKSKRLPKARSEQNTDDVIEYMQHSDDTCEEVTVTNKANCRFDEQSKCRLQYFSNKRLQRLKTVWNPVKFYSVTKNSQHEKLAQHIAQLSNTACDTSTKLISAEVNSLLNDNFK
jgi:hypothetical protein